MDNFIEMKNNSLGLSIIIPNTWQPLTKEYIKNNFPNNQIFAIYTDTDDLFQVICDGKCRKEDFENAYKKNIDNMRISGMKIIHESSMLMNLQQGPKDIKQVVVEYFTNQAFRVIIFFAIINEYFVSFSIPVDNTKDVNNLNEFNNQKNVIDIMNVISSITETTENQENYPDENVVVNINNKFDYSNIIPQIDNIINLITFLNNTYNEFLIQCNNDEQANLKLKEEYKIYTYKRSAISKFEIEITHKSYERTLLNSVDEFLEAIEKEIVNNLTSLKIKMNLSFRRGQNFKLDEYKNEFEINFKPYNIQFIRESNHNEFVMNQIESEIKNIMANFKIENTIFCSKKERK